LASIDHRPWPLPTEPWTWRLEWRELGFLHHRIDVAELRSLVPAELELDTFDGSAWVAIVPFRMRDVRYRNTPALPLLSTFPELNVRTYVRFQGKPGVWFFSLDATNLPFVLGARALHGIPYVWSSIRLEARGDGFSMDSRRRDGQADFAARYHPTGPEFRADPGSFAHWATERYCLYATHRGRLRRIEVHHAPWPLREAAFEVGENGLLRAAGLRVRDTPPVGHCSRGVEVVSYGAKVVGGIRRGRS